MWQLLPHPVIHESTGVMSDHKILVLDTLQSFMQFFNHTSRKWICLCNHYDCIMSDSLIRSTEWLLVKLT